MKNDYLYQKAKKLMPGGVNSPVRASAFGIEPLYIKYAEGSRLYDEEGREYIDFVGGYGPAILGHGFEPAVKLVQQAAQNGFSFGWCHRGEIKLAEIIIKSFPSIDMIRLVNSGTEAAMSAVRAARGYTGREKIIKFRGCYHGHSDVLLGGNSSGIRKVHSDGLTEGCTKDMLLAEYNDEQSVIELFEIYKDQVAAVIVEPCCANMGVIPPKPGFLKFLRSITSKWGAVLIFDEVITGFRLSPSGAQGDVKGWEDCFNTYADITVLGKIIGGGLPLAAYGGKREIMEKIAPLGEVYQAGTLSGNPIACAAGIAVLEHLQAHAEIYSQLEQKGKIIEQAMIKEKIIFNRCGSLFTPFFTSSKPNNYSQAVKCDRKLYGKLYKIMRERGIIIPPSPMEAVFISAAHSVEDINKFIEVLSDLPKDLRSTA